MLTLNCKECDKEFVTTNKSHRKYCSKVCSSRDWNRNNPHKRRKTRDKWAALNPNKDRLSSLKYRATQKSFEFNLTEEDFVEEPEICPVLGIKLERSKGNSWNSPSVDRIDNTKGYVKGNVRVISKRANSLKSDATIEELELILADAKRLQWE